MIYLLLPVFNEANVISVVLQNISSRLPNQSYSLVVVNDGSTDDTLNILNNIQSKINLKILNHENNLGLGAAMKTGINYISSVIDKNDILITMDADNTHPADLIPQLSKKIQDGFDVVIASRYAAGGKEVGLKKIRKILSKGISMILKLLFPISAGNKDNGKGTNISDYTSGYRAYSGKILIRAKDFYGDNLIAESGFTCMVEILIKLSKINASVDEVGLVLRYDLKRGKSKIKIVKTIIRYFVLILKFKLVGNKLKIIIV
ncbi:MAG: glycosyltransferase family 2 protein [Elusimicrobia bacterium]|nr:glycosyltransferase family 2 protein [Elusimicrobiota bacterium]